MIYGAHVGLIRRAEPAARSLPNGGMAKKKITMLLAALAAAVVSPYHNKLPALRDRIQELSKWPTVAKLISLVYKGVCVCVLSLSVFVCICLPSVCRLRFIYLY